MIDIDDEKKLATFYERRIGHEVEGDVLGDEFKGFVFRCVVPCACARKPRRQVPPPSRFPAALTHYPPDLRRAQHLGRKRQAGLPHGAGHPR